MKKLDRVLRLDNSYVTDKDKLLRNKLSENVTNTCLKRELKKIIRARPTITFTDIREEALVLARDQDDSEAAEENNLTKCMTEMRHEMANL